MAYELHIQWLSRDGVLAEISIEDWLAVASQIPALRASTQPPATNPRSGEKIGIGRREGDLDVYFPQTGTWQMVFRRSRRGASFVTRFNPWEAVDSNHEAHPAWHSAVQLATALGAEIVGDEGEV